MILQDDCEDFVPAFHTVGIYVRVLDTLLLLLRHPDKPQANKWGVPGGKVQHNESVITAVRRELEEETSIRAEFHSLRYFETVKVRYPEYDFFYSTFSTQLKQQPSVVLSENEHSRYGWFVHTEALRLELIEDEDQCLRKFFCAKPIL